MTNTQRNGLICAAVGFLLGLSYPRPATAQTGPPTLPALDHLDNAVSAREALNDFQDFVKYPPESRPLHTSNWDLLNPWTVDTATLPLIPRSWGERVDSLREFGLQDEAVFQQVAPLSSFPTYHFEVNKLILAGTQDEFTARLMVYARSDSATRPSFHVTGAELTGDSSLGNPSLGSVPFSCETADNSVCTFRWKAPSADKQYWGNVTLHVTVSVEGQGDDFEALQDFYSSPIVAGKFTGGFQERIEDGSLLIDAGVSVQRRMACFASANLYSADSETPTHHAERRLILDPSMKTITFTFFGKIFRDNGYAGTFRLQDLKVQCENLPYPPEWFMDSSAHIADLEAFKPDTNQAAEPERVYFEYNNFTYTTKSYSNTAFSDKEWQSPELIHKLALMQKVAQQLEDNAAASDTRKQ